jgi:flagellar biosynthesis protein FlhA
MKAVWVPDMFSSTLKRDGYIPIDVTSVLLTHLAEVIRNNLSQLLSYKDLRVLLDRLDTSYRRLLDEICPSQISYSGLQSVLKLLLAERISIRNLHLILEAVAEITPFTRKAEQIVEHVRLRLAPQICGDLGDGDVLKLIRMGNRWEVAFHQALKRDQKGEVVEFDIDPRLVEQFGNDLNRVVRPLMDEGHQFSLVVAPDARPYVRMVTDRLFTNLPVLSHMEISRGAQVQTLGSLS